MWPKGDKQLIATCVQWRLLTLFFFFFFLFFFVFVFGFDFLCFVLVCYSCTINNMTVVIAFFVSNILFQTSLDDTKIRLEVGLKDVASSPSSEVCFICINLCAHVNTMKLWHWKSHWKCCFHTEKTHFQCDFQCHNCILIRSLCTGNRDHFINGVDCNKSLRSVCT